VLDGSAGCPPEVAVLWSGVTLELLTGVPVVGVEVDDEPPAGVDDVDEEPPAVEVEPVPVVAAVVPVP
jgi:hypothetical protein